jgi:hypothetical protein
MLKWVGNHPQEDFSQIWLQVREGRKKKEFRNRDIFWHVAQGLELII